MSIFGLLVFSMISFVSLSRLAALGMVRWVTVLRAVCSLISVISVAVFDSSFFVIVSFQKGLD